MQDHSTPDDPTFREALDELNTDIAAFQQQQELEQLRAELRAEQAAKRAEVDKLSATGHVLDAVPAADLEAIARANPELRGLVREFCTLVVRHAAVFEDRDWRNGLTDTQYEAVRLESGWGLAWNLIYEIKALAEDMLGDRGGKPHEAVERALGILEHGVDPYA